MTDSRVRDLGALFSDYRAEWSDDLFSKLFIAPPYFAKLEMPSSCLLVGGRGTGKTTALRSLTFDASLARLKHDGLPPDAIPYFGIYIRINKNRVRAFQGPDLAPDDWGKAFAHYFNLLFGIEVCKLIEWRGNQGHSDPIDLTMSTAALGLDTATSVGDVRARLDAALNALELYVNNPRHTPAPVLSMAESPVRRLVDALTAAGIANSKHIFCCIDEYENLLDYQQAVINTYIKHSEPPLSYKIGVKKGGLRSRATIDNVDVLSTPDDYAMIDIGQESFDVFAKQVLEQRLRLAKDRGFVESESMDEFLPELPFSIEADRLGCGRIAEQVLESIIGSGDTELVNWARDIPKSELYFLKYWSESGGATVTDLARDWRSDPSTWATRLGNYGYASLFWLSRGRKGARLRKFYAGARTFIGLASGNIRYFIELIDEALNLTASEPAVSARWTGAIQPEHQTLAARTVGKRRLDQLEGLSEHGSEIKRLVLAVGKVFFEFARDPVGRSPELNSFVLTGSAAARDRAVGLLTEGVSILAFEATPRTKATTQGESRDDEYRLHPIFAPFFEYSHRRKRRVSFSAETLLDAIDHPRRALLALLGRDPMPVDEVPDQLALFSPFYEAREAE